MATVVEIAIEPATTELGCMGLLSDSEGSICRADDTAYFYFRYFPLHPLKEANPQAWWGCSFNNNWLADGFQSKLSC